MNFIGISCYDQSTFCSAYQNRTEYCANSYSILINDSYLSVLEACQHSCGQCLPVRHVRAINNDDNIQLGEEENSTIEITTITTISTTTTTTTTLRQNMIFSREDE